MTSTEERAHQSLADITASLSLLSLIAQFIIMVLMLISFRELREQISASSVRNANQTETRYDHRRELDLTLLPGTEPQEELLTLDEYEALCD